MSDGCRAKAVEHVSALARCMSDRCRAKAVECVSALARSEGKQCRAKAVENVSALARQMSDQCTAKAGRGYPRLGPWYWGSPVGRPPHHAAGPAVWALRHADAARPRRRCSL